MVKKKNKEIAIYEEIRSTAVSTDLKNQKKVGLGDVFGRSTLGNPSSFGGNSLIDNSKLVDEALANVNELEEVWNRSHTQWTWKHINLSWHSPMRNMRQISAEISSKKGALNSAKWRHIKDEIRIRKIESQLAKLEENYIEVGTPDYWKEVELKVKLAELKEGMVEGAKYIEGAMKDVLSLNALFEDLKQKVSDFSEHDVELAESKSHLKRSLVQCIRDVRQSGSITKGEQEYMEQIGVNPSKIQKAIRIYIKSEEEDENWDVTNLHIFVDKMVDELIDTYNVDKKVLLQTGFSHDPVESFSNINKYAQLNKPTEE